MRQGEDLVTAVTAARQLREHVTDSRTGSHIHGYDVQSDLVRHYSFAEIVLTALTGESPDASAGHAFSLALSFLAPVGAGTSAAHAAILGAVVGAPPPSVQAIAAVALSSEAAAIADRWLPWLEDRARGGAAPPPEAGTAEDRAAIDRLRAALGRHAVHVPAIAHDNLTLAGALVAVLHASGLRTSWQVACAITLARLPVVCAEARCHGRAEMRDYPINVPAYVYREDDRG
jgi:hypothetical protein